jgi:hypothetical protein
MRFALLLILPSLLAAQVPSSASPALPVPDTTREGAAESALAYRGFSLAAPYAEFTLQARALVAPGAAPLVCNTSRRTAQLMECGELIRDPADSAQFYLAAYVLEGQVAFLCSGIRAAPRWWSARSETSPGGSAAPRIADRDVGVALRSGSRPAHVARAWSGALDLHFAVGRSRDGSDLRLRPAPPQLIDPPRQPTHPYSVLFTRVLLGVLVVTPC